MSEESEESAPAERRVEEGRRFALRMYLPRTVGLGLGAVCIGGGFWEMDAALWRWALLAVASFGWPHLAYRLALRSRDPYRAELRNLMLDSVWGGVFIALMSFNLAPSAVLVSMLAMDKVAVGGMRFLARCLAAQVSAAVVVAVAAGIEPQLLQSGPVARFGTLPLLLCYPIMVGLTAYYLAGRVRQQNEQLRALSATDGLTGLPNHTTWEQAVEREYARCRRGGHPCAVLMLDLDHFKAINDTHGHPVGDKVLREVAEILRNALRAQDLPGRYGGEEFGVLLPGSGTVAATAIAERIRKRLEAASIEPKRGLRVTASIGCAALDASDSGAAAWIARADRALYQAKAAGRNRSVCDNPQVVAA